MTTVEIISAVPEPAVDHSRQKRVWLVVLAVWSVIYAILCGVMPGGGVALAVLFALNCLASGGILIRWAFLDFAERQYEPRGIFTLMLFFFPGPVIMVPVYFFQSRDRDEARAALWRAVGYYLVVQVVLVTAITLGVRYLQG